MKLQEIGVEVTNGNLTPVGTIAELIGKKGKVSFALGNLVNQESKVFFDLTDEAGVTRRLFGSKAVSKMIKTQQLKKSDVLGLMINQYEFTEGERKGEIGYVVSAPKSETVVISGEMKPTTAVGAKLADYQALAAW